jgi:glycosyltransferase involved in cell wall biosynthesis
MANQTRQLARLLTESGCGVELVQVNAPYRPACVGNLRGLRALFRLVPYLARLWRCAGRADLFHVMANSGWAWHLCAAPAVWIARLRGVGVVVNYRGGEAEAFLARAAPRVLPTLRRAAAVIVPSTFLEGVFRRHGVATIIVPNVIDLSRFHPAIARARQRHVVVTRNLEDIYDIPTALRAFAQLRRHHPDARMTVAGSGPCLPALQALVRELGLDGAVAFPGRIDNERIGALYRDADLVLNPSTADNMPNSLLEAMASGVPVVTTDVGGIPHLVTGGVDALLVPARDPAAMADAARRVLADPQLAASLAGAGLRTAARYTWAQVQPQLFDVYARALGRATLRPCTP